MNAAQIEREIDGLLSLALSEPSPPALETAEKLCKLLGELQDQESRPAKRTRATLHRWVRQRWDLSDLRLTNQFCELLVLAPSEDTELLLMSQSLSAKGEQHKLLDHALQLARLNLTQIDDVTAIAPGRLQRLAWLPPSSPVAQRDLRIGAFLAVLLTRPLLHMIVLISTQNFTKRLTNVELEYLLSAANLSSALLQFAIAYYFVCFKYGQPLVEGFSLRRPSVKVVVSGLVLGLVGALVTIVVSVVARAGEGKNVQMMPLATTWGTVAFVASLLCVSLATQLFHQGFMFPAMRQRHGAALTVSLISVEFAYLNSANAAAFRWGNFCLALFRGLLGGWQREVTGSPWSPIIMEWSFILAMVTAYCIALAAGL